MNRCVKLRLTGRQHAALKNHLFPGDGDEAVALALCGVAELIENDDINLVICVNKIILIPYEACQERMPTRVKWKTDSLPDILKEAINKKQVLLKIHCHPSGNDGFSSFDDDSDKELFKSIAGWLDIEFPGISAIMFEDGRIIARTVSQEGEFKDVISVAMAGDDVKLWYCDHKSQEDIPEFSIRTVQSFGHGTTCLLSKLSVGVVGVSGTGSPVIEMLYRLGVGKLVIVDGDVMEGKNVGRIYNSTMKDASEKRSKVYVLADAIERSGLPTKVIPLAKDVFNTDVVRKLAQCDVIFGCVDSIDGRDLINRIAAFYSIPYFDLGVRLIADVAEELSKYVEL